MDFDTLTTKPIEPRAAKFSAKQKTEFATKFKDVVRRIAYPDSGEFFRDAKLKFGAATEKGEATVVPIDAHLAKEDLRTKIELYWGKKGGTLKLVDVAFDGDSLIKDYQNQFARIVDKEGVSGLMKKVDEKRAELDKGVRAKEHRREMRRPSDLGGQPDAGRHRRCRRARGAGSGGGARSPAKVTADQAVDMALAQQRPDDRGRGQGGGVEGPPGARCSRCSIRS